MSKTDNENMTAEKVQSDDTTALVVKTAIRTVLSTLVIIVLLAALSVTFFPYEAMRVYMDLGMKSRALECAESYLAMNRSKYEEKDESAALGYKFVNEPALNSRFVTALYNSCELSISLYLTAANDEKGNNDNERLSRAKQIIKYTEEYLAVPGIQENLDELSKYAVSKRLYFYHASLYSYRDFLARYNYIARLEGGKREDREILLYNGALSKISDLESVLYNRQLGENIDRELSSGNTYILDNIAEALNLLSAMISFDFGKAGVGSFDGMSENDFAKLGATIGEKLDSAYPWFYPLADRRTESKMSGLLLRIEEQFEMLKEKALAMPTETKWQMVDKLYVMRSLSNFADNVWSALMTLSGSDIYNNGAGTVNSAAFLKWQGLNSIENYGSLRDYYNNVLMKQYAAMLTAKNV